jgi:patatin-related protein
MGDHFNSLTLLPGGCAMGSDDPPELPASTQEVRFAATMTGGVSLAIWMAGVAREINLLGQASQWRRAEGTPDSGQLSESLKASLELSSELSESAKASLRLYKALIDLLDIVVDVDILSGTSAGGINAALLALSRVKGYDLGGLRDLWLDLGALTDLIRDPTDKNTPSLLYGDERMFAVLAEQLPDLARGPFPPVSKAPPPTTLYVTTTLLTGETSRFTDSFGTLVQDVDRRGVFTFTDTQLVEEDIAGTLALAARSSASFPVAFEPSFVPFNEGTRAQGGVPARPAMDSYANITRAHWVADGGLLDNQPIDVLLQRIFDSPATRPVRRVLLFVVPSSGPAPDAKSAPEDDVDQPFGLVDGLLKDLSAMTAQSIAADLRAIRAHQDRMGARADTRLRLAELARRLRRSRLLTPQLLTDYRTREATKQADILAAALLRQLSTWPPEPATSTESIPTDWQADLAVGGDAEKVCRRGITESILGRWPGEHLPRSLTALAAYGPPAYELAKGCAISVARAAYLLAESKADPAQSKKALAASAELTAAIHEAYKLPVTTDLSDLVRTVCTTADVRLRSLEAAAAQLAKDYFEQFTFSVEAWEKLARAVLDKYETLRDLVTNASSDSDARKDSLRGQDYAAARQLNTYLDYLQPKVDPQSPEATLWVARQLFDLAVTQRAMLPAEADIEQSLELVQVSADTRSLLAPTFQTAQQKLTGMQFHHFGAFYKRSWRANDWMWGRLDGAGWLVHVLLDPRRVRWVVQMHSNEHTRDPEETQPGAHWLLRKLRELGAPAILEAGYSLPPAADKSKQTLTEKTLRTELEFIDDPDVAIPASISWTSLWLAQVWQQRVLDEELDGLAQTVIDPQPGKPPDWSPATSRTWAEKVWAAKGSAKYALLGGDPVAKETFSSDAGSPLMAHTVTKLAATTSSAARSVRQLPGVLKPPLITLQTLALGGYRAVSLTNGVASWSIKIGAVLLVLGITGATQDATLFGVGGLISAGIGGYLIVLGTWQSSSRPGTLRTSSGAETRSRIRQWLSRAKTRWRTSRIRRRLSRAKPWWRASRIRRRLSNSKIWRWLSRPLLPLLSVTLVGAVLSLATPVVRKWLFGTGQQNSGLVGSHVYWLGVQWWHPLIVVGAIILVITLVGILAGRPGRK